MSTNTSPPPVRRYSTREGDGKPLYHPDEPTLPFSPNVRIAAIDVMILTLAAKRHADWLASIGECPDDIKALVRGHIENITATLGLAPPAPPQTPDVGTCSRGPKRPADDPNPLFNATRRNVCDQSKGTT